jgi:hypothetical protein
MIRYSYKHFEMSLLAGKLGKKHIYYHMVAYNYAFIVVVIRYSQELTKTV